MDSPVVQELLIGLLGGVLSVPMIALLVPLSGVLSDKLYKLQMRVLGDGFLSAFFGLLWIVATVFAAIGLPMLFSQWVFSHWGMAGMPVEAVWFGRGVTSSAGSVNVVGMLAGMGLAQWLGKRLGAQRLSRRWQQWLEGSKDW